MTEPTTQAGRALLGRLRNTDDLYPCPECMSVDGPCVDHERVRAIVATALAAIEREARAPLLEALRETAEAAHQTGGVRDHWAFHPTRQQPFSDCEDSLCVDNRALLTEYDK